MSRHTSVHKLVPPSGAHASTHRSHRAQTPEIVRYCKQNISTTKTIKPYSPQKILARTDRKLLAEIGVICGDSFHRREENLRKGPFTPITSPYRDIGNLELDPEKLILETMSVGLPPENELQIENRDNEHDELTTSSGKNLAMEASKERTSSIYAQFWSEINPEDTENGFIYLRRAYKESNEVTRLVRAGISLKVLYADHEKQKIKDDNKGRNDNGSEEYKESSKQKHSKPENFSVPSKISLLRNNESSEDGKNDVMNPTDENSGLVFSRKRRNLINKFSMLNSILCAMYNVKIKDLKSKKPLSHEAVKNLLSKDVNVDSKGRAVPIVGGRLPLSMHRNHPRPSFHPHLSTIASSESLVGLNKLSFRHASRAFLPQIHQRKSKIGLQSRFSEPATFRSTLAAAAAANKSDGVSSFFNPTVSSTIITRRRITSEKKSSAVSRTESRESNVSNESTNPIDTWEDIVNSTEKYKNVSQSSILSKVSRHRGSTISINTSRRGSAMSSSGHRRDLSQQPYWLTFPFSSGGKKSKAKLNKLQTYRDNLQRAKQDFCRIKNKFSQSVYEDVKEIEKNREEDCIKRFQVLKITQLFKKDMSKMRKNLIKPKTDLLTMSSEQALWFLDIRFQCEILLGNLKGDVEVNDLLRKLARFSFENDNIGKLPYAKEKLCLLVISMPAERLMDIHIQEAVYFILDRFLETSTNYFSLWLKNRNVPLVLIDHPPL